MAPTNLPHDKPSWRVELKQRLAKHPAKPQDASASALASRFVTCCPDARVVMLYAATADEAPTHALIETFWRSSVRVALPVVLTGTDHAMTAFTIEHHDELMTDRFGISALDSRLRSDARRIAPEHLDAVAVPGLGFDIRSGVRIGRGGGYYDRFLARCPHALRIGLAFDEQLVQGLPAEPHDVPMHAIVTPTQTLRFNPPR